jgi:hypothetical protein
VYLFAVVITVAKVVAVAMAAITVGLEYFVEAARAPGLWLVVMGGPGATV